MGSIPQTGDDEATLLARAIEAGQGRFSVAAAQAFLRAEIPAADRAKMEELGTKARAGALLPDESALLDRYVRVCHLLVFLKSKARRSLDR
jgi:hypothetical protein